MTAYIGCLSPAIPTKRVELVRVFKETSQGGHIVDIDVGVGENKCMVSGCHVEAVTDAESIVTILVQRCYLTRVAPPEYQYLLASAYNAGRWYWTLKRECERRAVHDFFFSPVLRRQPPRVDESALIQLCLNVRLNFAAAVDVKQFFAGVLFRRGNFSKASLSVTLDVPQDSVFNVCKTLMPVPSGVVRCQIPDWETENSVSLVVSGDGRRIYRESYTDNSESLVISCDLGSFTGFSVHPAGDNRSHVTIAFIEMNVPAAVYKAWKAKTEQDLHGLMATLIHRAMP